MQPFRKLKPDFEIAYYRARYGQNFPRSFKTVQIFEKRDNGSKILWGSISEQKVKVLRKHLQSKLIDFCLTIIPNCAHWNDSNKQYCSLYSNMSHVTRRNKKLLFPTEPNNYFITTIQLYHKLLQIIIQFSEVLMFRKMIMTFFLTSKMGS